MSPNANEWTPLASFYFQVKFMLAGGEFIASFLEVDGLESEMEVGEQRQQGDSTIYSIKGVKFSAITLKRCLSPLDEAITKWIKECFSFPYTCKINPCKIIISLLDNEGRSVAAWECRSAIPTKWSLASLKSDDSKIAVETITLKHAYLGRIV